MLYGQIVKRTNERTKNLQSVTCVCRKNCEQIIGIYFSATSLWEQNNNTNNNNSNKTCRFCYNTKTTTTTKWEGKEDEMKPQSTKPLQCGVRTCVSVCVHAADLQQIEMRTRQINRIYFLKNILTTATVVATMTNNNNNRRSSSQ